MILGVNGNALTLQFGLEQHGKTSTRFTLTDILDFTASSKDIRKPKDSVTLQVCTFVVFCISLPDLPLRLRYFTMHTSFLFNFILSLHEIC